MSLPFLVVVELITVLLLEFGANLDLDLLSQLLLAYFAPLLANLFVGVFERQVHGSLMHSQVRLASAVHEILQIGALVGVIRQLLRVLEAVKPDVFSRLVLIF